MSGRLCMLNSHASALVFIVIKLQFTSSMLLQVICWCLIMFAIANVSLDLVSYWNASLFNYVCIVIANFIVNLVSSWYACLLLSASNLMLAFVLEDCAFTVDVVPSARTLK